MACSNSSCAASNRPIICGSAEDLLRFGVLRIELQRPGERFDRLANLFLREIGIAERIPAPGRFRTLLHVFSLRSSSMSVPLGVPDVAFQLRDSREVVRLGYAGAGRGRRWRRGNGCCGKTRSGGRFRRRPVDRSRAARSPTRRAIQDSRGSCGPMASCCIRLQRLPFAADAPARCP